MPHLLGLTGNIACGKTTVGQMLLELGAAMYIDADAVVHDLYRPGAAVHAAIVREFGEDMLTAAGEIDRQKLGALVFADPAQLRRLEALVHPAVEAAIAQQLARLPADAVAVVDAVKLLEGGLGARCDAVWLVACDPAEELRRLMADRGLSRAEASSRLFAQPDRTKQRAAFSAIIDNSGDLATTRAQVSAAWERFQAQLHGVR